MNRELINLNFISSLFLIFYLPALSDFVPNSHKKKPTSNLQKLLSVWLVVFSVTIGLYIIDNSEIPLETNISIKKPNTKEIFTPPSTDFLYQQLAKQTYFIVDSLETARRNSIDTSAQRILLTGDSMAEGLYLAFRSYASYNNHYLKGRIWYSSLTIQWSKTDSLKRLIELYKPTIVIFTLGANELFRTDIYEREKDIQDIIAQAGDTPFIWVGPPNWKDDTGINEIIERNMPANTFFLSKDLEFERERDGAHPTRESSRVWADTIANWIMNKSRHKILLEKPIAEGSDDK